MHWVDTKMTIAQFRVTDALSGGESIMSRRPGYADPIIIEFDKRSQSIEVGRLVIVEGCDLGSQQLGYRLRRPQGRCASTSTIGADLLVEMLAPWSTNI